MITYGLKPNMQLHAKNRQTGRQVTVIGDSQGVRYFVWADMPTFKCCCRITEWDRLFI
jgi:hypothetical protein